MLQSVKVLEGICIEKNSIIINNIILNYIVNNIKSNGLITTSWYVWFYENLFNRVPYDNIIMIYAKSSDNFLGFKLWKMLLD